MEWETPSHEEIIEISRGHVMGLEMSDDEGHRIVVGSFAGATRDPSWVLNLRDRTANPRVRVRIQGGMFWSEQEVLDAGPERDALWVAMLEDRAWYADYQAKTERVIPLVRLAETEAITD